ncbi:unnamed protein product [Mytilus coruscus]|uniref:Uncharacterized protein n=1 Tax=Mytilus coruscus TaxID=42192 RepID=A0A6J8DRW6_MYTCO|nr:unnamed protein product [Mytilus coruscus]
MKLFLRVLSVAVLAVIFVGFTRIQNTFMFERQLLQPRNTTSLLLVNTAGCKIMKLDPFDMSIRSFFPTHSVFTCRENEDIVYVKHNTIFINWNFAQDRNPTLKYCKYDVIWRPINTNTDHNFFRFINESKPFTDNQTIHDDFIRVRCFDNYNHVVYRNAFSFVHLKKKAERRCIENFKKHSHNRRHLSILMIGVDSISRNNMIRYMPKTRHFLYKNLSALDYLGYNKVADNTFLNMVPMTTGKFVHELPLNTSLTDVSFDQFDFIWNKFSEKGYRTLYSEDASYGQIFDYEKAGFKKPTADYFDRPLSLVLEDMHDIWNTNHHCVHARLETDIYLEYTRRFVQKFKTSPYFSFTFISRLTHDELSNAKKADDLYYRFFKSLSEESSLNNTIIFFYSDHGIRFGQFRQTFIGKIKERLPFLFIILPQWFKVKYPEIYTNCKTNQQRLISPFDIFETMTHILNFYTYNIKNSKMRRGLSLFNAIPQTRRCEDANILPHWCTCSKQHVLSTGDQTVRKIARHFIQILNSKIASFKQCETLFIKRVISATKIIPTDVVLKYVNTSHVGEKSSILYGHRVSTYIDYQISLQTVPGDAMFEFTVRYDESESNFNMTGDFSRINLYNRTSYCISGIELKKICYCKVQT